MMQYTRPPVLTADRSLPRKSIVMMMRPEELTALPQPLLPDGYSFRLYRDGDAAHWARIATIVDEFDTDEAAARFFAHHFLPEESELRQRCAFVTAPDGMPVATVMAWMFSENGVRHGRLHWVCTDPAHQGKGIGRAIVLWALHRMLNLEPGKSVYLDTQTWSHKAIGLYLRLGFHPVRTSHPVLRDANEYDEAAAILSGVVPEAVFRMFIDRSVN